MEETKEQLSQDCDTGWDIHTVYQLTPELAQWMAAAGLVVMIDASREGEPGELRVRPLSPSAQPKYIQAMPKTLLECT